MAKRRDRWTQSRQEGGWHHGGIVHWVDEKERTAYLSVVFSWNLPQAYSLAIFYREQGYHVLAGGPAVALNPTRLVDVAETESVTTPHDVIARHNPWATRTSYGCPNRCSFCAVPKMEGKLVEMRHWPVRPVLCDNNFLACSRIHFDRVVDKLKRLNSPYTDFNQGLDAKCLTKHHADRLAELPLARVRLAWDTLAQEPYFRRAVGLLDGAGIPREMIRVYVLVNHGESPEEAHYRAMEAQRLGVLPYIMRYQPLDVSCRDAYLAPGWTELEITRMRQYYGRDWRMPFEEFRERKAPTHPTRKPPPVAVALPGMEG